MNTVHAVVRLSVMLATHWISITAYFKSDRNTSPCDAFRFRNCTVTALYWKFTIGT